MDRGGRVPEVDIVYYHEQQFKKIVRFPILERANINFEAPGLSS